MMMMMMTMMLLLSDSLRPSKRRGHPASAARIAYYDRPIVSGKAPEHVISGPSDEVWTEIADPNDTELRTFLVSSGAVSSVGRQIHSPCLIEEVSHVFRPIEQLR